MSTSTETKTIPTGATTTDAITPIGATSSSVTLVASDKPAEKVIPIGTFENIIFYFGTLFGFAFCLFMLIKLVVGTKS
jgi:hypothetical protein